ncbi:MAG: hypothetical protein AAFU70_12935 [Planctomycetota bacterium]
MPAGTDAKRLIAIAADGRRAEAKLEADQHRVTLTFSEPAVARPVPRGPGRPVPTPRPRGGGDDELADSPYGAQ